MRVYLARLFPLLRAASTLVVVLAAGGAAAYVTAGWQKAKSERTAGGEAEGRPDPLERPHRQGSEGLIVPAVVAHRMGLQTAEASTPNRPIQLPSFQGCLAMDSNRLARVHSRFAGEVVSIGRKADPTASSQGAGRTLRYGDPVRKGDLLAVVWSKDLGEKKSELVDALSKLRADEVALRNLEEGYRTGSFPESRVLEVRRTVEADRVAADRAERTLRAWRVGDEEIAAVREEARKLGRPDGKRGDLAQWARVEVRAPRAGVVLEKNVVVGDIVDTTTDLFKIGDLSRLVVWAHVYEEDLPLLERLPKPIPWRVHVSARAGASCQGTLDQVGSVIDPNQHTALVTGHVENPTGELKVGQFVTVSVDLPAPTGEVELPPDAVVEDGRESVVFVQTDAAGQQFELRKVQVVRRLREAVYVRAEPNGVRPGQRVVTSGALLLREALDTLPRETATK